MQIPRTVKNAIKYKNRGISEIEELSKKKLVNRLTETKHY